MLKIIVALLLTGLAANLSTESLAGTADNRVEIPQTGNPAPVDNPPCGGGSDNLNYLTADLVLQGITSGIDYYIGYPVTSTIWEHQPPGNKQWLYDRLGVPKSGPSFCSTLCVVVPADQTVTYQTCYSETGGDGQECFGGDGHGQYFAAVNTSFAQRGNARLLCATGKNWSHNRNRWFWVHAEW